MKTKLTLLALALGASTCLVTAQDGPPPADNQRPPMREGGPSGPGDMGNERGGPGAQGGFHVLPPRAQEQLKLTDDQKKQIAALEADTKAKLEKILTPQQMQQLKTMRPPMRQGGPAGQGGPPMRGGPGDPGGPGGQDLPEPPPGEGGGNFPPSGPPPGN